MGGRRDEGYEFVERGWEGGYKLVNKKNETREGSEKKFY